MKKHNKRISIGAKLGSLAAKIMTKNKRDGETMSEYLERIIIASEQNAGDDDEKV